MYELITSALKVLQSWPVVNGFFIITITFLTIIAIRKGDKDRKSIGYNVEMPAYLMVHDIAKDISDIKEENEKRNTLLPEIVRLLAHSDTNQADINRLLEDIRNTKELYAALNTKQPKRSHSGGD